MVVARSGGRTNPSVNIDEPLISNARSKPRTPSAWNIAVNATITISNHTERQHEQPDRRVQRHDRVAAFVGACCRRASRLNTTGAPMNTARVTNGVAPRGSTNVRSAESKTSTHEADPERRTTGPRDHVHGRSDVASHVALSSVRRRGAPRSSGFARRLRGAWRRVAALGASRLRAGWVGPPGRVHPQPSASRSRSRSRASSRLRACERVSERSPATTGPEPLEQRRPLARAQGLRASRWERTSTRVSDVFACWPPGPPERLVRHSSSSSADHAARA